jgi:hypothetical protein
MWLSVSGGVRTTPDDEDAIDQSSGAVTVAPEESGAATTIVGIRKPKGRTLLFEKRSKNFCELDKCGAERLVL